MLQCHACNITFRSIPLLLSPFSLHFSFHLLPSLHFFSARLFTSRLPLSPSSPPPLLPLLLSVPLCTLSFFSLCLPLSLFLSFSFTLTLSFSFSLSLSLSLFLAVFIFMYFCSTTQFFSASLNYYNIFKDKKLCTHNKTISTDVTTDVHDNVL